MKKWFFSFLLIASLSVIIPNALQAQCSLCQATAETSLKDGNNSARGLNAGIFYLLVIPYILVGGIGYWWYTKNKEKNNEEA
jgi:hypothetical protein